MILKSLFFLPKERKIAIERWLRGWQQYRMLRRADCVVVSFGKSGRTWLRVMLSRFYQTEHGLSKRHLIGFDNLHRKNRAIPRFLFTHDNYVKDYTGNTDSKVDYYDKKIILLVRSPADVAVSQYFQWRYRMKPAKKDLNDYPEHGNEVSIFDFVVGPNGGLPKIIDFMNGWAREIPRIENILVVRYEDMRENPEQVLSGVLDFIGTPGAPDQIGEAVHFASVENMRKLEAKRTFRLTGGRLTPKDRSNPDSYKVRRAKVGGYRDYFSTPEVAEIDTFVQSHLSPAFGYDRAGAPARAVGA
ncbi:MAG: sulfotransferase domain-containing protein [Alphaproteobacteria bacterium]